MNIYLDNSATSWPKPPDVVKAVTAFLNECGGSPGRSAHSKSLQSARLVFETRELIADFFNAPSSDKVIFTANATHAINIAIKGILRHGDHVIISAMEHNSVIRPLRQLEESGKISLSILPLNKINGIEESDVEKYVQPDTKLLITTHCSNVNGFVFPVEKIGQICRKNNIIFMVDAAQSAGIIPIDMQAQSIDVLVFTGHKKLYGPTGTGGLCLGKHIEVDALMQGGTGSNSEEEFHPEFYPDKLEAGTLNIAGIAGLNAGILFIQKEGVSKIQNHLSMMSNYFIGETEQISELSVFATQNIPVISLASPFLTPDKLTHTLDSEYGIMTRPGLHCSPLAHKSIGTFPQGTVRFSPGYFNTEEQIIYTIQSLKTIFTNINKQQ